MELPALQEAQTAFLAELQGLPEQAIVIDLLRRLINSIPVTPGDTLAAKNGKTQEIILTMYLDGACYSILRSYLPLKEGSIQLSPREQEIARLVAKGFPNKSIGILLEISPWTVSTYLRRIFTKLGVNSRAEMVAKVMKDERPQP